VREIVGFVMGAAAGAAGALFAASPEGKALIERLRTEARPDVERATTEWEPVLNEVARAVRLAVREVETATVDLRARIAAIAAAEPEAEAATAPDLPVGAAAPAAAELVPADAAAADAAAAELVPAEIPAVAEGAVAGPSVEQP
jgi:hypothetical protein